jgi:hypothetical protein
MKSTPVDAQLDDQRAAHPSLLEEQRVENRRIVESLFDFIRFLGMLGLTYRGHESNMGNFVVTVQFLAKYHTPQQHWLEKHPRNVSYMSAEIQNEMIDINAKQIMQTVTDHVKAAKWFSICADETADTSGSEQLSLILRYVYEGHVYESLISVTAAVSLTGNDLAKLIVSKLGENGFETQ